MIRFNFLYAMFISIKIQNVVLAFQELKTFLLIYRVRKIEKHVHIYSISIQHF